MDFCEDAVNMLDDILPEIQGSLVFIGDVNELLMTYIEVFTNTLGEIRGDQRLMANKNMQYDKLYNGIISGLESYRNIFLVMKVFFE